MNGVSRWVSFKYKSTILYILALAMLCMTEYNSGDDGDDYGSCSSTF
jgi:hypothetical protein